MALGQWACLSFFLFFFFFVAGFGALEGELGSVMRME